MARTIQDVFGWTSGGGGGGADPALHDLNAYKAISELGISAPATTQDIYDEIVEFTYLAIEHDSTDSAKNVSDAPEAYGTLVMLGDASDNLTLFHGNEAGVGHLYRWDSAVGYKKILTEDDKSELLIQINALVADVNALDTRVEALENEPNYVSNFDISMDFTSIATTNGGDVDMTSMTANDSVVTGDPIKATTIAIDAEGTSTDFKWSTSTNSVYTLDNDDFNEFRFKLDGLYVGKTTRFHIKAKRLYTGDNRLGLANYLNGGTTTFNLLERRTTDTSDTSRTGDFPITYDTYTAEWTPTFETEWFGVRVQRGDIQEIRIENTSSADVLQDVEFRLTQTQHDVAELETEMDDVYVTSDFEVTLGLDTFNGTSTGTGVNVATVPVTYNELEHQTILNTNIRCSVSDTIQWNDTKKALSGEVTSKYFTMHLDGLSQHYPVTVSFKTHQNATSGYRVTEFETGGNSDGTGTWTSEYIVADSSVPSRDILMPTTETEMSYTFTPTDTSQNIRVRILRSYIKDIKIKVDTGDTTNDLLSDTYNVIERLMHDGIPTIPAGTTVGGLVLQSKDDGTVEWVTEHAGSTTNVTYGTTLPTTGMVTDDLFVQTGGSINYLYIYDGTSWLHVADYAGAIATNATDIGTNRTDIATNATDIATNATDIATNTTAIATNAGSIATNITDISALEDRADLTDYRGLRLQPAIDLAEERGYSHGNAMTSDFFENLLEATIGFKTDTSLGANASLGISTSYGNGFFGGNSTTPNSSCVVIKIPKEQIPQDTVIAITRKSSSGSGHRQIWVYAGDATSTINYQLHPITNSAPNVNNSTLDATTSHYQISYKTPIDDIYIYMSKQYITDIRTMTHAHAEMEINREPAISDGVRIYSDIKGMSGLSNGDDVDYATMQYENYNTIHDGSEIVSLSNGSGDTMNWNSIGYMYATNSLHQFDIDLTNLEISKKYRLEFYVENYGTSSGRYFSLETTSGTVLQKFGGTGVSDRNQNLGDVAEVAIEFTATGTSGAYTIKCSGCKIYGFGLTSAGTGKSNRDIIYSISRQQDHIQTELDTLFPKRIGWVVVNPDTTGLSGGNRFTNIHDGQGDMYAEKTSDTGEMKFYIPSSGGIPATAVDGNQSKYSIEIKPQVISNLRTDGSGNLRTWKFDTFNAWTGTNRWFEIISQLDDGAGYVDADYADHSASKLLVEVWQNHA